MLSEVCRQLLHILVTVYGLFDTLILIEPVETHQGARPQVQHAQQRPRPIARVEQKSKPAPPSIEEGEDAIDGPELDGPLTADGNSGFSSIDSRVLATLQDVLDEMGLNTASGAQRLARLTEGSAEYNDLVKDLMSRTGLDRDTIVDQLSKWRSAQDGLAEEVREVEVAKKTKRQVAIWRCAVCGRADQPYIACYVAPYIVRYEPIP